MAPDLQQYITWKGVDGLGVGVGKKNGWVNGKQVEFHTGRVVSKGGWDDQGDRIMLAGAAMLPKRDGHGGREQEAEREVEFRTLN
eukprot:754494-Hanusia_phi.AAC.5